MNGSLTSLRVALEAAQQAGMLAEWSLTGTGRYLEITWADRSRSLVPRDRAAARLQAQAKAEAG